MEYKYREYAAVIKLSNATRKTRNVFFDVILDISMISLSRLMDGGAAILALTKRNHNSDSAGTLNSNPFVNIVLRV